MSRQFVAHQAEAIPREDQAAELRPAHTTENDEVILPEQRASDRPKIFSRGTFCSVV
jgi:hypothetical protein